MYYIIGTEKQYTDLQDALERVLPQEVLVSLYEKVKILDSNYGASRDLQQDSGGFCAVFPTIEDWKEAYQEVLNKHYIQKDLYEYREQLSDGRSYWVEELYITNNDYGIVLYYQGKLKGEELC